MIAALLIALTLQTPAAAEVDCDRAANTQEINACVAQELAREEARMNRYLQAAQSRLYDDLAAAAPGGEPGFGPAWLDASQSAWVAYADIRCRGVFDQWKDGTIRTVMALGCRIEATRQRTHDIWTDHLTFGDSTPPILPEPTGAAEAP